MKSSEITSVIRFYHERFCAAFPDADVLSEITEKNIIRSRLGYFFEKPLTNDDSVWFSADGYNEISSFCFSPGNPYEFLGQGNNFFALDVTRVVPICKNGLYYTACVYVESRGVVNNRDLETAVNRNDCVIIHKSGRNLSSSEYNSGCFYDGTIRTNFTSDEVVTLSFSAKPSNLLIIPKFGTILHEKRDLEIQEMLNKIIVGKAEVEDLKKLLFSFSRPDFNYNEFNQEPHNYTKLDPELLAGLLHKVQETR